MWKPNPFTFFNSYILGSTLYIKSMVCIRCKMAVEAVLKATSIEFLSIELGRVHLVHELTPSQMVQLEAGLKHYSLELMEGKAMILVEQIKLEINNLLHAKQATHLKLSVHLSQVLGYHYTYLSNLFSELEGMTLERYFITQRVERVKELMVYEDLSVSQVMYELSYSSVSHLSAQFKKVTGMTPASFKKQLQSPNFSWRPL